MGAVIAARHAPQGYQKASRHCFLLPELNVLIKILALNACARLLVDSTGLVVAQLPVARSSADSRSLASSRNRKERSVCRVKTRSSLDSTAESQWASPRQRRMLAMVKTGPRAVTLSQCTIPGSVAWYTRQTLETWCSHCSPSYKRPSQYYRIYPCSRTCTNGLIVSLRHQ